MRTQGPKYLINAATKIHGATVFCVAGPLQVALADVLQEERMKLKGEDSYWYSIRQVLKTKRDRMFQILTDAGLHPILPNGGYFMLADVSDVELDAEEGNDVAEKDQQVAEWLIKEKGVAAIPLSLLYASNEKCDRFLRFCFMKHDTTIDAAEDKIKSMRVK